MIKKVKVIFLKNVNNSSDYECLNVKRITAFIDLLKLPLFSIFFNNENFEFFFSQLNKLLLILIGYS